MRMTLLLLLVGCSSGAPAPECTPHEGSSAGIEVEIGSLLVHSLRVYQRDKDLKPAVGELTKLACRNATWFGAGDPAAIPIEEMFPLKFLALAQGAGCGSLDLAAGPEYGAAWRAAQPHAW